MKIATRAVGMFLLGSGAIGLLLCIIGFFVMLQVLGNAERALDRRMLVLEQALTDTGEGLRVASQSLQDADQSLVALNATIGSVNQTITDTLPTLNTLSNVVGTDMPKTIESTREALRSAQSTALVVDQVLGALSGLGVITLQVYNPNVPLNTAVGNVSKSLEPLPASFQSMHTSLQTASGSMIRVQRDTQQVGKSMQTIRTSVTDAQKIVQRYTTTVEKLQGELRTLKESLPRWLMMIRIVGIVLLIWLGAAQLGLITQGYELTQRAKKANSE